MTRTVRACLPLLTFLGHALAVEATITPATVPPVAPGGVTVLTAAAHDGGTPTWQWRYNGEPITGATGATLEIPRQVQNSGRYDVLVTSDQGIALAKPVEFAVQPVWPDPVALHYPLDRAAVAGPQMDATQRAPGVVAAGTLPALWSGNTGPLTAGWDFASATTHPVIAPGPALANLGDPRQGSGLTLACWLRLPPDHRPKGGRLGQQQQGDQAFLGMDRLFYAVATNQGGVYVQFGVDYYTPYADFTTGPLDDGAWHHVVFTCDYRSGMTWSYLDGVRQKVGPLGKADVERAKTGRMTAPGPVSNASLHLGADAKGKRPWKGGLADVILLTKPLTDTEAKALAQGAAPGAVPLAHPAPLVRIVPPATVILPDGATEVTVPVRAVGVAASGTVTYAWANGYHMSKEMMRIDGGKSAEAQVTLQGAGDYGVVCTVTSADGQKDSDYQTIRVRANQAPTIGSIELDGGPLTVGKATTVRLSAAAHDDRLPAPPALLALAWTQVSGPKPVIFATPWLPRTEVTVPGIPGDYVVRLTANDGAKTASQDLTLTVGATAAPVATATAAAHLLDLGTATTTTLTVSPAGSACQWTQVGGPPAVIASPSAATTTVTLDALGTALFQATVTTPQGPATATTWVTAWQPGALRVEAGSSRLAWLPDASLALQGRTAAGPTARIRWSVVGGPGKVDLTAPTALATRATFAAAGVYELQLEVVDGNRRGQDRLVVEVYPAETTFGYGPEQRAAYTADLHLAYDPTGLAWSRIAPPPAPGVHPRILFNPEDLPDLRRRLTDGTAVGPLVMAKIREEAAVLTRDAEVAKIHAGLLAGDLQPFLVPRAPVARLMGALKADAFRCLIDEDAAGAATTAKAVAAAAEYLGQVVALPAREHLKTYDTKDWRVLGGLHAEAIAWCYDFLAPAMTPTQRGSVRRLLVRTTDHLPVMGVGVLPGPMANCSNWLPLTSQGYLFTILAIEGEEGADPAALRAYAAAVQRQTRALAWPDGSLSEGGGKGWLGCEQYLALGKRGYPLAASDTFRNHLRQFFLHCQVPEGYGFTMDEMNGGTAIKGQFADDLIVTKYLYPQDPLVDFVYRQSFSAKGEDPAAVRIPFRGGYLLAAICAERIASTRTWEEDLATAIRPTVPLTCWFANRGLLVTRSAWTTDATRLYFQPRCVPGGHTNPDRNVFTLHALGRCWVPMRIYQSGSGHVPGDSSMPTSIVRVDDHGSGDAPAAEVDVFDSPRLTCATGDASDAYRTGPVPKDGPTELIPYTYNQKHRQQLTDGWADQPWGTLPHWYSSQRAERRWGLAWPEARACRTAALVRPAAAGGPQPYVLIADDVRVDAQAHDFAWRMMLPDDLRDRAQAQGNDVVYTDPDGRRALLVRLLACDGTPQFRTDNRYQFFDWPWLDIQVKTVAPKFRVLLLPFVVGTPLPTTTWQGEVLTIDHGGGRVDRLTFSPQPAGWTKIRLVDGPTTR